MTVMIGFAILAASTKLTRRYLAVVLCALLSVMVAVEAHGQSPELIDALLETDYMTHRDAAALIAVVSAVPARPSSRIRDDAADQPITVGQYSRLLMRTFNIPGGVLFRLTGLPRYAARDLAFRGIIQGDLYPGASVSGQHALRILGRVLELRERGAL